MSRGSAEIPEWSLEQTKELQQLLARRGYYGRRDRRQAGSRHPRRRQGGADQVRAARRLLSHARARRAAARPEVRPGGAAAIGERARPALQHQGGVDDQAAPAIVERALEAAGQGCGDLGGRQRADRYRHRPGRAGRCRDRARARGGGGRRGCRRRPHWRPALPPRRRSPHRAPGSSPSSAMPSEKERPRAPDVAMPPTPDAASRRTRPLIAGTAPRENSPATPISSACPGVTSTAMSPPSLTKARSSARGRRHVRQQLVGDRAGDRRHRRHEHVGEGPAGLDHAPRHRPVDRGSSLHRRAQRRQLVAQLRQDRREPRAPLPHRPRAPPPAAPTPSAPRRSARATGAGARR